MPWNPDKQTNISVVGQKISVTTSAVMSSDQAPQIAFLLIIMCGGQLGETNKILFNTKNELKATIIVAFGN